MLLDIKKNGKAGDTLKDNIHKDSHLPIISALFPSADLILDVSTLFSKIETTSKHHLHF